MKESNKIITGSSTLSAQQLLQRWQNLQQGEMNKNKWEALAKQPPPHARAVPTLSQTTVVSSSPPSPAPTKTGGFVRTPRLR
jgi:hypothetical protein